MNRKLNTRAGVLESLIDSRARRFQILTTIDMVFDMAYPSLVERTLSWLSLVNLDIVGLAPFDCLVPQNFYTSCYARIEYDSTLIEALICSLKVSHAPVDHLPGWSRTLCSLSWLLAG